MAEESGKLIKALDQFLPFLASSPLWLKYWTYAIIFLNLLTVSGVAISYLVSKQAETASKLLTYFSIDRPLKGQKLPLAEGRAWMLEGKFPLLSDQEREKAADVAVEVFKLPDRRQVPQDGRARVSTVSGLWRFESARFAEDGAYEIIATATMGGKRDFRTVSVECLDKGEAYKVAVDTARKSRGVPPLEPATRRDVSLPAVKRELQRLQEQFFTLYPRDPDGAERVVERTLDVLDPVLPAFPDDHDLQNTRAYTYKNAAMLARSRNRPEEAERALKEAEQMFEAIRQQDPNDAGAWNGLGSVAALQGKPELALHFIDRALELAPSYEAAREDRLLVLQALGRLPRQPGQ